MEQNLQILKKNILKRLLGKRMFVVTNSLTDEGYCGVVTKVISHDTVFLSNEKIEGNVNIFDLRSPSRLYNCE